MISTGKYDAVVVGSGPNGLAAAIYLRKKGLKTLLTEEKESCGGGMRTAALTNAGFKHDICSALHPLAYISPFFSTLPLEKYGLEWIHTDQVVSHPFENGKAAVLYRDPSQTAEMLHSDRKRYLTLTKPLLRNWGELSKSLLDPMNLRSISIAMVRFGLKGMVSASRLADDFREPETRALLAGLAAHAILPLDSPFTSAFALVLGITGHYSGWPFPKGGADRLATALANYYSDIGGEIKTAYPVRNFNDLPDSKSYFFDLTPKQILNISGEKLKVGYVRKLKRYRYGPGVFKADWAVDKPVPFTNQECRKSVCIHLGGTFEDIEASERAVFQNQHPEKPYIILVQHTIADPSRSPENRHTVWAYCHVPNGSRKDMTEDIENRIEDFAPGFRQSIIARSVMRSSDLEHYNSNYVGGDINGGIQDFRQLFFRPVVSLNPYATGTKGIYVCSSSTPPGGGVHGMCGYNAARRAYKHLFEKK